MIALKDNKILILTVKEQCLRHVENSGKVEMNFPILKTRNRHTISPNCFKILSKSQVMKIKK